MRVVGGRLKGRRLIPPGDRRIRPTGDRTREALFNILESRYPGQLEGGRVADIFAGTGALGIEALSRGAREAVFVEKDRAALDLLRRNLATLGLSRHGTCRRVDATRLPPAETPFDIIFMDPPYGQGLVNDALESITTQGWHHENSLIILECGKTEETTFPPHFTCILERCYGDTKLAIIVPSDGKGGKPAP